MKVVIFFIHPVGMTFVTFYVSNTHTHIFDLIMWHMLLNTYQNIEWILKWKMVHLWPKGMSCEIHDIFRVLPFCVFLHGDVNNFLDVCSWSWQWWQLAWGMPLLWWTFCSWFVVEFYVLANKICVEVLNGGAIEVN
jgi:hypothetical protein